MSGPEKEPAVSDKTARAVARGFAFVIVGAVFAALVMVLGWGLVALWGLLFG